MKDGMLTYDKCLDVIGLDGAHCIDGTLLSVYGLNSNRNVVPLVHGYFVGNESTETWTTMFQFLVKEFPLLDEPTKTWISDRDKGLLAAHNTLKNAKAFACSQHRGQNVSGNCDTATRKLYDKMVSARTMKHLEQLKKKARAELSEKNVKYLLDNAQLKDENQFIVARVNLTKPKSRMFHSKTQQFVEIMNRWNKAAREVHVCASLMKLVNLEATRYRKKSKEAHDWKDEVLTPYATHHNNVIKKDINLLKVTNIDRSTSNRGVVEDVKTSYAVDFQDYSCECGKPDIESLPCKHMLAFAKHPLTGVTVDELYLEKWTSACWRSQYPLDFEFMVPSKNELFSKEDDEPLAFALARINPKGRKKTIKRKKGPLEMAQLKVAKKQKK